MRQFVHTPGPAGLLSPVPAQRARLLLAEGDVAQVARWVSDCAVSPGEQPDCPREPSHLVLAQLLIAQDRPDQALALLDRLDAAAVTQDRWPPHCSWAFRTGTSGSSPMKGRRWPPSCPGSSRAQRYDKGAAAVPLAYPARLQRASGAPGAEDHGNPAAPHAPRLVGQLTGRELEVLAMLASGQSNQNIAGSLFISLDTVKKHVSHVLSKLGADNRTETVARGRALGLID